MGTTDIASRAHIISSGIWKPMCSAMAPIQSGAVIDAMLADMKGNALAEASLSGNSEVHISTNNAALEPCINPPPTSSTIISVVSPTKRAAVVNAAEMRVNII